MSLLKNDFDSLMNKAKNENLVTNIAKQVFLTLFFGVLGMILVPYSLNLLLSCASMEPVATKTAGFLIGAAIFNLDKFGKFKFVSILSMLLYVAFDVNMFDAVKVGVDFLLAAAPE